MLDKMGAQLGRYEIVREIAQGGMAAVYLGRVVGEGGFERLVALKVMHAHIAKDPQFVAMFLDEARLAAKIRHPNVVPTLDIQKTDDGMFLVMEFVDGPPLQELRKYLRRQRQRLPIDIALRIVIDVLNGLHEAHEQVDDQGNSLNIVHRDVTPHNILVGKDGISRITDFGVARAEARISSTRTGQLKGKMSYMAPEQVLSETVERRGDVYSAGVVLWEALTGQRLFRAENEGALLHKVLQGPDAAPHEVNVNVPPQIGMVVMRAMSHNVENRYDSAEQFVEALEAAARVAGQPIAKPKKVGALIADAAPKMAAQRPRRTRREQITPVTDRMAPSDATLVMDNENEDQSGPSIPVEHISQPSAPATQNLSEPSGVFGQSWTHTEAVLGAQQTRNRHGLIAAVVGGSIVGLVVVALVAVLATQDDASTPAAEAPTGEAATPIPAPAPAPPDDDGDDARSGAGDRALPRPAAIAPKQSVAPQEQPKRAEGATRAQRVAAAAPPPPAPLPVAPPRSQPKPSETKPVGTSFRPSKL